MKRFFCLIALAFAGCFHSHTEEDDLRTVPVTNNPNIVPNYGRGLPGVGGNQQGPY